VTRFTSSAQIQLGGLAALRRGQLAHEGRSRDAEPPGLLVLEEYRALKALEQREAELYSQN